MRFSQALILASLIGLNGAALAAAPEPQGLWTGAMHGDVPATLSGGQVIHTKALAELLKGGDIALVDVSELPQRPADLAPGGVWKPAPHRNIKGSIWLPGVGAGKISGSLNDFFLERLEKLTDDDPGHLIVFYCHPNCWASWNAAKRAINFGYRNVYWYPDGIEGWQDAGLPLAVSHPADGLEQIGDR